VDRVLHERPWRGRHVCVSRHDHSGHDCPARHDEHLRRDNDVDNRSDRGIDDVDDCERRGNFDLRFATATTRAVAH
jgi:hypothetical protein